MFDVGPGLLPPLRRPGEQVGEVSADAAARTGLRRGTPLFQGAVDQCCAALGAGNAGDAGVGTMCLGTVGIVMRCGDAPVPDELETRVELTVNAFLPDSYVRGSAQRVEIYKRISMVRTPEDRADIIDELIDRFGDIPDSVMNLLDVALVRALCVRLGIDLVRRQNAQGILRFDMRYIPDLNRLSAAMEGRQLRFSTGRMAALILPMTARQTDEDALKLLCSELNAVTGALDAQAEAEKQQ